jgi:hypothetical protein
MFRRLGNLEDSLEKFPAEGRERKDGSERVAMALVVLSRAKAARLSIPPLAVLAELVERVD